jgi:hypothetical protein
MTDIICKVCKKQFQNRQNLNVHVKLLKHYSDVLFTCLLCQHQTLEIDKFISHDCGELYSKITLVEQLASEKSKVELYRNIIKSNTNINIDGSPLILKRQPVPIMKDDVKQQKFRNIKGVDIREEFTEKEINDMKSTGNDKLMSLFEHFSPLSEVEKAIEETFEIIKTSRTYKKSVVHIQKLRMSIMGHMSLELYIKLINTHINILKQIFDEKKYADKKIIEIIKTSLSGMEHRLVLYSGYSETFLEQDDIESYEYSIDINNHFSDKYQSFDTEATMKKFFNYTVALFHISKTIKKYIINIYGFHNIIYMALQKSSLDDPFSFYVLDDVGKKRKWKMDCRLIELTFNIINTVLPYMITMFRTLYFSIYGNNDYTKNFSSRNQMAEFDCQQLLQNIIIVSNERLLSKLVRNIIVENSTYLPATNDKFNIYGDDPMIRTQLSEYVYDPCIVLGQVFDDISSSDAVDLYRSISC